MLSENQIRTKLEKFQEVHFRSIKACVIKEALDYHSAKDFFTDLMTHGCRSGMISSLIYYHQTHKFFDEYYNEIEDIRDEVEFETGCPVHIDGDLKNELAWMAFEHEAYFIADFLGLT
nr:hypothetical protein [uncultured Draconibacterium sp.]